MNKFIFLDIDGVMNSNLFYSERTQDKRYNDWIKEPIHDITPYMRSRHRGSEIQEWLDKQTEPYRYVIFDDDTDMLDSQLPYFIQSDWLKWGLSDEDVEQAIHILNDTNTTAEAHL